MFNGKGGLGTSVEYFHYDYAPNSESRPDFAEAGLELKCTPLKLLTDNSMGSKERLVLNIINFIEEADKTFETSSFWNKNKFLLTFVQFSRKCSKFVPNYHNRNGNNS